MTIRFTVVLALPMAVGCSSASDDDGEADGSSSADGGAGASAGGTGGTSGTDGVGGTSGSGDLCNALCSKLNAAGCPMTRDGDLCVSECQSNADTFDHCIEEHEELRRCYVDVAAVTCTASGVPIIRNEDGCMAEFRAYRTCNGDGPMG